MSEVTYHGLGIYCEACREVYDDTDACDHNLSRKHGIKHHEDGYIAQPENMNHLTPHMWADVDGMEMCGVCGATKLPAEMVEGEQE